MPYRAVKQPKNKRLFGCFMVLMVDMLAHLLMSSSLERFLVFLTSWSFDSLCLPS
jgi:hypothetical protein